MFNHYSQSTTAALDCAPLAATQATPDEALVERIAGGDQLAMQALFARHNVRVFRFILATMKEAPLAEDLVNEVFLDVWRQASRFEARSTVLTWLLAIARFKALSALRRRPHETADEAEALTLEDPSDDPEAALQRVDRSKIVRTCLAALSSDHREIVDLAYYHEQSIDDIAKIVGIPVSTVKTRMFYARKHLAELLASAGVDRASL
jgi:RNA polymerase sigma-70 factor (ECF subfamily)